MTPELKQWLEFYYGTSDVTPAKIADSFQGDYFQGYSHFDRNQEQRNNSKRVLDYAVSKGTKLETNQYDPDGVGHLSSDDADKYNKELSNIYDKAKNAAWVGDESVVASVGSPLRGLDVSGFYTRPNLLYSGLKENTVADGYMMLIGHGSKEILSNIAYSKKGLKELGTKEAIGKAVADVTPIRYSQLIPEAKHRTAELHVVGVGYTPKPVVYLTDGKATIIVNADMFAWMRQQLPDAKLYGTVKVDRKIREDANRNIVWDKDHHIIWDETVRDELDPASPISFVEGDKVAGVVMPLHIDASGVPGVIKDAVTSDSVMRTKLAETVAPKTATESVTPINKKVANLISNRRGLKVTINDDYPIQNLRKGDTVTAYPTDKKGIYDILNPDGTLSVNQSDVVFQTLAPEPISPTKVAQGTEAVLAAIEQSRSPLSRSLDESQQHSVVIDPDDQRTRIWKRDPGRMDVRGIDTRVPKRRKAKQNRKTETPAILGRVK